MIEAKKQSTRQPPSPSRCITDESDLTRYVIRHANRPHSAPLCSSPCRLRRLLTLNSDMFDENRRSYIQYQSYASLAIGQIRQPWGTSLGNEDLYYTSTAEFRYIMDLCKEN